MPIPLDTLAYAPRLKAAGFTEAQAEAQADALAAAMTDALATKADLRDWGSEIRAEISSVERGLKARIEEVERSLRGDISQLRCELGELRADMRQMEGRITIRLGGMLVLGVGALAALSKIL